MDWGWKLRGPSLISPRDRRKIQPEPTRSLLIWFGFTLVCFFLGSFFRRPAIGCAAAVSSRIVRAAPKITKKKLRKNFHRRRARHLDSKTERHLFFISFLFFLVSLWTKKNSSPRVWSFDISLWFYDFQRETVALSWNCRWWKEDKVSRNWTKHRYLLGFHTIANRNVAMTTRDIGFLSKLLFWCLHWVKLELG